jgi:uncharacterized protein YraI
MRLAPSLLGAGLLAAATSVASAKPAYVPSAVNLRAAPNTTSEVVVKIPGGSLLDADNCTDGWCAVTWQGKSGFAIQSALDLSGRVPVKRAASSSAYRGPRYPEDGEVVEDGPVYVTPPPGYYYGGYYGPYYGGYYYRGGWGRGRRW